MKLNNYLYFNGDCEAAFKFYEKVLGGKINAMMPHAGSPAENSVPKEWAGKILHAHMTIGESVLMASDAPPNHYEKPQGFSINIPAADVAEAERVFKAMSEGGKIVMPIAETFWALRFGMFNDRFGIPWMVNCEKPRQ
ncbi:MAG TPA: VOC family protein [Terriglobales bacterium]|jgi:PhnB protein|nr:VOC family protein [Terriglobales bacterium]